MKMLQPNSQWPGQHHVVIIGAGFAGLNAAKRLAHRGEVLITLIDRRNHHLFQPLLYQVATAGLNPSDIAVPIRAQFANDANVSVHLAEVNKIDLQQKCIYADKEELCIVYDSLIMACGAQHSYFGHPQWERLAPGLKTLEQATEIRRRILSAFEIAENELNPQEQNKLLTFVIIGGGPTGVELAGAIADISRTVLIRDFRRINPAQSQVILVEAGPRILNSFPEDLSAHAVHDLMQLGVQVRCNARVSDITETGAQISGEKDKQPYTIATHNIFWAAGVQAAHMVFQPEVPRDRAGRVLVERDFSIPSFPQAYVIGDMAALSMVPHGSTSSLWLPGQAPAAIQAGKYVADVIMRKLQNKSHPEFRYLDKGQMATIGKHKAISISGPLKMTGYVAWVAWLFVHILYLVGFKNRISVTIQWAWNYLFSKRGSRLITEANWKQYNEFQQNDSTPKRDNAQN